MPVDTGYAQTVVRQGEVIPDSVKLPLQHGHQAIQPFVAILLDPCVERLQQRFVFLRGGLPPQTRSATEVNIPIEPETQKFKAPLLARMKAAEAFERCFTGRDIKVKLL
ncbi:hypothetical protein [Microbulbifer sp. TB1203]|uniref:hypothetical protein n=1 Tax=Microbulbifer sp. TB1203 TaxID=3021712 RepID=UPI0027E4DE8F|nr:hypothetical protein [Microbulbifer sp. TB1203]